MNVGILFVAFVGVALLCSFHSSCAVLHSVSSAHVFRFFRMLASTCHVLFGFAEAGLVGVR